MPSARSCTARWRSWAVWFLSAFLLHAPVLDFPQRSYRHVLRLPLGDPGTQRIAVQLRLARQDAQRAPARQVEEARPEGALVEINTRAVWCHGRLPRGYRVIAAREKNAHGRSSREALSVCVRGLLIHRSAQSGSWCSPEIVPRQDNGSGPRLMQRVAPSQVHIKDIITTTQEVFYYLEVIGININDLISLYRFINKLFK